MPDILDLRGLPAERYAAAGLLLDLYPLLDADPDIERGDLFPALLAALETDGHLYSIPTGYYLVAVCGNPETIALTEGLTLAEADAAVRAAAFGSLFWRQLSRDMALRYGLLLGNFADYGAGTARFTDGDFAELLEYAATLPEEAASAAEWPTELYEGGQAVCLTGIYTIEDFASLKVYLGGEVALTPLFSEQGRYVAELMGGYAVTSACGNTEAAWDFLRTYLGPEPRTRPYEDGLPLNIAAYEAGIEAPYLEDKTAGEVKYITEFGELTLYDDPEANAAQLRALLGSELQATRYDNTVEDIVMEEAEAYFAGAQSAQAAAAVIQDRVSLYLAEQG